MKPTLYSAYMASGTSTKALIRNTTKREAYTTLISYVRSSRHPKAAITKHGHDYVVDLGT